MYQALARSLFVVLAATSCKSHNHSGAHLELSTTESATTAPPTNDEEPPAEVEQEEPGDGVKMQLEEGAAGARQQGKFASLTGTGDFSSGFDDANVHGGLLGNETSGAFGSGRQGFGPGGGGTGTIGTGRYGTIGMGSGRGGMRGRSAGIVGDGDGSETYKDHGKHAWVTTATDHLSTFAADVDTASYTIVRRKLEGGDVPPSAAVRVEELVNYFKYTYAAPERDRPFSVAMDMAPSPFGAKRHVLRVGVSTQPVSIAQRKPANLVFLVDVSGSMQSADKLPLAKRALRILVDNLKDGDTVALVTYAGATRVALPPTGLEHRARILAAIEELQSGGSTAMGDGISLAYQQAAKGLRGDAISRVVVLSDGDANVGRTTHEQILATIQGHVKEGVTLSTIGFGMGNYKDELMEQLANKGNGNNFYIDGLSAAKRVFQEQLGATLEVVAKDVKLQVDFDKARVTRYRLIGYENRDIKDADFRDDKIDAGEIGAGHQVTALYEVELAAGWDASAAPVATVRVRHKPPRGTTATEHAFPMSRGAIAPEFAQASADLRFAFATAAFADVLRGGDDAKDWDLRAIKAIAAGATKQHADRAELVSLIDRAITLRTRTARNP